MRTTTILGPCGEYDVWGANGFLCIGFKRWSRARVRALLRRRRGTFRCTSKYEWRLRGGALWYRVGGGRPQRMPAVTYRALRRWAGLR